MRSPVHANFVNQMLIKRQSNVNRYLSSFPGEKVSFHTQIRKMEKEKKYIGEALDSLAEYPQEKHETYTKGRTGESH